MQSSTDNPHITVSGEKLQAVSEFKYLGVWMDSNLSFKTHTEKIGNRVKFNLANFRFIRNYMSTEAAKMYVHSMILTHFIYCITSWSQANSTTCKPLEALYKQTLKVLDKKPRLFHHCPILEKYSILSWDNLRRYANTCLVYKVTHDLAAPPLSAFITPLTGSYITRGVTRGDCIIPHRKSTFSKSAWSVEGSQEWNSTPADIRDAVSYKSFCHQLKEWMINSQTCTH